MFCEVVVHNQKKLIFGLKRPVFQHLEMLLQARRSCQKVDIVDLLTFLKVNSW